MVPVTPDSWSHRTKFITIESHNATVAFACSKNIKNNNHHQFEGIHSKWYTYGEY